LQIRKELGMNDDNTQGIKSLFTLESPADNEILLSIRPISYGCFGVYAGELLLAMLRDRATAHAFSLQLIRQQAIG
jgi:hypothetical protein